MVMYGSAEENVTRGLRKSNPVFLPKSNSSVFAVSVFAVTLYNISAMNKTMNHITK